MDSSHLLIEASSPWPITRGKTWPCVGNNIGGQGMVGRLPHSLAVVLLGVGEWSRCWVETLDASRCRGAARHDSALGSETKQFENSDARDWKRLRLHFPDIIEVDSLGWISWTSTNGQLQLQRRDLAEISDSTPTRHGSSTPRRGSRDTFWKATAAVNDNHICEWASL